MILLFYRRDGQTVVSATHTSTGCLTGLNLAFRWKNRFNLTKFDSLPGSVPVWRFDDKMMGSVDCFKNQVKETIQSSCSPVSDSLTF